MRFLQSTVRFIDPNARRVVTDDGTFEADVVVALGADLHPAATPGLVEGGNEFYSPLLPLHTTQLALLGYFTSEARASL